MPVGAAIAAAGGVASAGINYFASGRASNALQSGYAGGASAMDDAWARMKKFLGPYANVGRGAMQSLASLYGIDAKGNFNFNNAFSPAAYAAFERSPDYAYARDSAMRTLGFSNSASSLLKSSEHLRSATGLASGLATQNFGNFRNALTGLGQWGLDASSKLASGAGSIGTGLATLMGRGGEAEAAGIMGQAGAINSGINSVTNALTQYNALNRNNTAYTAAPDGYSGSYSFGGQNVPTFGRPDYSTPGNLPVGVWAGM